MPHSEHTMQETPDAKSVRFDVFRAKVKNISGNAVVFDA